MTPKLFSFGHGYSAEALARLLAPEGWQVVGTTRSAAGASRIARGGATPLLWPGSDIASALAGSTHVLVSVPPDSSGCPVCAETGAALRALAPVWVGYLSTTGVYGDRQGGWVDEDSPCTPSTARGQARLRAEAAWSATGLPVHVFRLAGIYGPGRGPFEKVRNGTARRIIKAGQVFSRIHVEDIACTLAASIRRPDPGRIYNLCDDDPAPPEDVIAHAADLLGLPPPPEVPFDKADLGAMARSFYAESKRVSNERIKRELGVRLLYPSYREGLAATLASEV